jgi:hypothetical protein
MSERDATAVSSRGLIDAHQALRGWHRWVMSLLTWSLAVVAVVVGVYLLVVLGYEAVWQFTHGSGSPFFGAGSGVAALAVPGAVPLGFLRGQQLGEGGERLVFRVACTTLAIEGALAFVLAVLTAPFG